MSKNLRVFLLSVLVVVLSASMSFAATDWNNLGGTHNGTTIYLNGSVTLTDTDITGNVDEVRVLTGTTATLTLNTKTAIPGNWVIKFEDATGTEYDTSAAAPADLDKATSLTITRTDANTSIQLTGGALTNYYIPKNAKVVFDIAFKNDGAAAFGINADVLDGAYLGFGSYVEVFDNIANPKEITGFVVAGGNRSTLTVENGGTLAVMGGTSILTGTVDTIVNGVSGKVATLSLDVSGSRALKTATITMAGTQYSRIYVPSGKSLTFTSNNTPVITNAFNKIGAGTLNIGTNGVSNAASLHVSSGTLALTGSPSMRVRTGQSATFTVNSGANLNLGSASVVQSDDETFANGTTVDIVVRNSGTATLADKAVISELELYPFNSTNYNGSLNTTMDLVGGININVSEDASKLIINGMQTVNTIEGHGTIEINGNDANKDTGVMILRPQLAADYTDFEGTINGTNANVGLYTNEVNGVVNYGVKIFQSADVSIDNLIVYGGASLFVNEKTNLDKVGNIWLRSDRPGSNLETGLTVGKLYLVDSDLTDDTYLTVSGIKIDGTSAAAGRAEIHSNVIDNTIENVTLYANRDVDFGGTYPKKGIYAFKIAADCALKWDGTNTKGDGQEEANDFYQIQLDDGTTAYDIPQTKTAPTTTYLVLSGTNPLASGNNILVGLQAGLDINKGATLGGNLKFAGYNRFMTQVGSVNRKLNDGGEFAVNVAGNLTLSADPNNAGNRRVLVTVIPDLDVFAGIETTTMGQRFKVIGSMKGASAYTPGYNVQDYSAAGVAIAPDFKMNRPSEDDDAQQVTVECRAELPMLKLGSYIFEKGGTTFGLGGGSEFIIKIPLTLTYRGQPVKIVRDSDPSHNGVNHIATYGLYLVRYNNIDHYTRGFCSLFGTYEKGEFVIDPNDKSAFTADTLVRDDITCTVEYNFDTGSDDQYITLVGTAYKESVDIDLWVYLLSNLNSATIRMLDTFDRNGATVDSDVVLDAFKHFTIIREGAAVADSADKYGDMVTEVVGSTVFTANEEETVQFRVQNMRKVTYQNSSLPVLENGNYAWKNNRAAEDTYVMRDALGLETRVNNVVLVVYNGDYLKSKTTTTEVTEGFTIESDPNGGVIVSVPVSLLGDTNGQVSMYKGLALAGVKPDEGRVITEPVTVTLIAATTANDKTLDINSEFGTTVEVGGEAKSMVYDINPSDLDGDIHLIADGLPSWLGWTGNGSTLSYTTGKIPAEAVGEHTFKVIAYSGENSTANPHVVYTFTVTVNPAVEPAISGVSEIRVELPNGTQEATFSFVGGATGTFGVASNNNPAGLLTITGAGVATVNATGVAAGNYSYTITAGEYTHALTVIVAEPVFRVEAESNGFTDNSPISDRTYYAVFTTLAATEAVEWTLTDNTEGKVLHSSTTTDGKFVVEGTVRAKPESAEDQEQSFTVSAKSGSDNAALDPITFTVDADTITAAEYTAPAATTGDHTTVKEGYTVVFPSGTVASDASYANLPSWLKATTNSNGEVTGVEFAGVAGDLANGTTATAFVEATNADSETVYYKWNVTYSAKTEDGPTPGGDTSGDVNPTPTQLTVTASRTTVTLAAGATETVTLSSNGQGVTYTSNQSWAVVDGSTLTITAPSASDTVTITARASDGRTATTTITVTVVTPTVEVPVVTAVTRFSDENIESADVAADRDVTSWAVYVNDATASWATIAATGARTARVTLDVPLDLEPKLYTITVTATDANGTSSRASVGSFTVENYEFVGSSSGGCDAGFGAMALAFAAPLFLRRRRS